MEDCCYCQHRNSCMERSRCYPCASYKKEGGRSGCIIITAKHKGNKITRKAFSDTQAFVIINQLSREGCTEIGMKEENHTEGEK